MDNQVWENRVFHRVKHVFNKIMGWIWGWQRYLPGEKMTDVRGTGFDGQSLLLHKIRSSFRIYRTL